MGTLVNETFSEICLLIQEGSIGIVKFDLQTKLKYHLPRRCVDSITSLSRAVATARCPPDGVAANDSEEFTWIAFITFVVFWGRILVRMSSHGTGWSSLQSGRSRSDKAAPKIAIDAVLSAEAVTCGL